MLIRMLCAVWQEIVGCRCSQKKAENPIEEPSESVVESQKGTAAKEQKATEN